MNERYSIDYNRSVVKDTLLDEEIHYKVSNSGIAKIIKTLNNQEKELKNNSKTQTLALILGLLIGLIIGCFIL